MSSIAETVDKIRTLAESYDDLADNYASNTESIEDINDSLESLNEGLSEVAGNVSGVVTNSVLASKLDNNVATKAQGNEIITTLGGHTSKLTDFATELNKIGSPAEGQPTTLFEAIAEGGGGGGGYVPMSYPCVEMTSTTATLQPNVLYVWGEVSALTITLAEPTDTSIVNEYMMQFRSGSTQTSLTFTNGSLDVNGVITANSYVVVSIVGNSVKIW